MRIMSAFLLSFFVGVSLFFAAGAYAGDTNQFDQGCVTAAFEDPLNIPSNILSQTFTPSLNHLTEIKVYVNGDGGGKVGLKLYHGSEFMARTDLRDEPFGYGEVVLQFDDIAVTPGDNTYKIRPYVDQGNINLSWYRRSNCYSGGKAFEGDTSQGYDFGFSTHGYNFAVPSGPLDEIVEEPAAEDEDEDEADEEDDGDEADEDEDEADEEDDGDEAGEEDADGNKPSEVSSTQDVTIEESAELMNDESDDLSVDQDQDDVVVDDEIEDVTATTDSFQNEDSSSEKKEVGFWSNEKILLRVLFVLSTLLVVVTIGYLVYRRYEKRANEIATEGTDLGGGTTKKIGMLIVLILVMLAVFAGLMWFVISFDDDIDKIGANSSIVLETSRLPEDDVISDQEIVSDDSDSWIELSSVKYGYALKYPQESQIEKATSEFFRVTPEEYGQGITAEDKLETYSGDICTIVRHGIGTIRISASPNSNQDIASCTGITGLGSDCTIQESIEVVEIEGQSYESSGSLITCSESDYREVFKINFEDGTRIEYILTRGSDVSDEEFSGLKNEIVEIIQTFKIGD
ncbi:hypothetical protein ACFL16_03515 [Patescibacteria group bacterium]